jgi:predicted Zn-dependent protease
MLDKAAAETRYAAATTPAAREAALAQMREAAARYPLSPMVARAYVDMLHQDQQHQAVVDFLRSQHAISRADPNYHGLLGRAYAGLGKQTLHHQSLGEMYASVGAKLPAAQQFELARRANDGDFYTMSEVDARLRQLRDEVRREQEEMLASGRQQPKGGGR